MLATIHTRPAGPVGITNPDPAEIRPGQHIAVEVEQCAPLPTVPELLAEMSRRAAAARAEADRYDPRSNAHAGAAAHADRWTAALTIAHDVAQEMTR